MQLLLDAAFKSVARATRRTPDPVPILHEQLAFLAIGFEIERGHDVFADQNRQREIAEPPLLLGDISLETMLVVEKQMGALALDNQRVKRREDVHQVRSGAVRLQHIGLCPVLLFAGALDCDRHQFGPADACLDQAPDRWLAWCIQMADRVQAHYSLCLQGAIEQIVGDFPGRSALWRLVPTEMPRHQLVSLEHAVAL